MKRQFAAVLRAIVLLLILLTNSMASVLEHWTKRSSGDTYGVRYVGGLFLAVGPSGMLLTSTNGADWVPRVSGTSESLYGAAFGSGRYAVVGGNNFLTSLDGSSWARVAMTNGLDLRDVSFGGGRFVAVGGGGNLNVLTVDFLLQTNWSGQLLNGPDCFGGPGLTPLSFQKVGFAGSIAIAVGDICTGIWRSINGGNSWQYRTGRGTQYFLGLAFGNQTAIALGMEGSPVVSTNAFTTATNYLVKPNADHFDCDNYFVARDVVFGDGRFVAVGGCHFIQTTNGMDWIIHTNVSGIPSVPFGPALNSIAYGAGTFVIATSDGIYQSDSIGGRVSFETANPAALLVEGEANHVYRIQRSTNLLLWNDIGAITNAGSANTFTDPAVMNLPVRFYRTVTP